MTGGSFSIDIRSEALPLLWARDLVTGGWSGVDLKRSFIIVVLAVVCLSPVAMLRAEEAPTLVTVGPAWPGFTNSDGSGLYHDLIRAIFAPHYRIEHITVPTPQANRMLKIGRADIKLGETDAEESLLLAQVPLYENAYYVVFLKNPQRPWRGVESLTGKQIAWREGYYSEHDFPVAVVPRPVRSGVAALSLVRLGRVDYYVDDLRLIYDSYEQAGLFLDPELYGLEQVGQRQYFPAFADTEKGRQLKREFEDGMLQLARAGRLTPIYEKWGFSVPVSLMP